MYGLRRIFRQQQLHFTESGTVNLLAKPNDTGFRNVKLPCHLLYTDGTDPLRIFQNKISNSPAHFWEAFIF